MVEAIDDIVLDMCPTEILIEITEPREWSTLLSETNGRRGEGRAVQGGTTTRANALFSFLLTKPCHPTSPSKRVTICDLSDVLASIEGDDKALQVLASSNSAPGQQNSYPTLEHDPRFTCADQEAANTGESRRHAGTMAIPTEPTPPSPCARCPPSSPSPAHATFRSYPLCPLHITTYIHTKTIKRLETFRTRYTSPTAPPRKLLLALSLGVSSTSLLEILDWHLRSQKERVGRAGGEVVGVWVQGFNDAVDEADAQTRLDGLRERYPSHTFSVLALASALDLLPSLEPAISPTTPPASPPASTRLAALLAALPSASSRASLKRTLLHRLLLHHASATACSALLYGSTTTLLAERTLAEVASGKGFALPQVITDTETARTGDGEGEGEREEVRVLHPLRDVLRKEIQIYASLVSPPLTPLLLPSQPVGTKPIINSRDATIEGLMRGYFEGVESGFPAVVSNVVRTVAKLQTQPVLPNSEQVAECEVCGLSFVLEERSRVCGGCIRMLGRPA